MIKSYFSQWWFCLCNLQYLLGISLLGLTFWFVVNYIRLIKQVLEIRFSSCKMGSRVGNKIWDSSIPRTIPTRSTATLINCHPNQFPTDQFQPKTIPTQNNSNPKQFQPDQFPPESIPTLFVHTKFFYTDKFENNFLCTPNTFIQINMKLFFLCTKVIRFGTDRVGIDSSWNWSGGWELWVNSKYK